MKKVVTILIVLAFLLFIGGCLNYPSDITPSKDVSSVVRQQKNEAEQAVDDYLESMEEVREELVEEKEMDINEMYEKVETGMTFDEIRTALGEPSKVQKMESDIGGMVDVSEIEALTGEKMKTKTSMEYWYYMEGLNILQVGFTDGKVSSRLVT